MNETPYKSVNHALCDAYMTAVKVPYKVPSLVPSSASFDPKTWDEFAGDAGMIMAAVKETLTEHHQIIIDGLYVIPEEAHLDALKLVCCQLLTKEIAEYHPADKNYILYLVQEWAGYNLKVTLDWWCDKLKVNEKTLRRWKLGWNTARGTENGIYPILDRRLDAARGLLAPEFRLRGWIE